MSDLISYLTTVRFGVGAIGELKNVLSAHAIKRPLVVTDAGLYRSGLVEGWLDAGGMAAAPVFAETPENPTEEAVEAAHTALHVHDADGLIAIGGGSPIDLAKGVALMATHDGPLENYAAIYGGVGRIGSVLPLIAIPTTAGTGSEVGRAALITLRNERKLGFVSPNLIPTVAICDPELTLPLPAHLTAATGLDAISHCVETFLSPRYNPPADAIALDGLARAYSTIGIAVADGHNLNARADMMMAALQGALAFQKGLGAIHSASHALGGLKALRLHHGTLNAVLLPHVLRLNEPAVPEKFVRLRHALGLEPHDDVAAAFSALNASLGLPESLGAMGVDAAVLDKVAAWSQADHSTATNPAQMTVERFRTLLGEAL
ncbi:MAG: iron-containing alcohol dehydrogenase [Pseudomonadota bacterium]